MNKNCGHCGNGFEIAEEDLAFFKKISPEFGGRQGSCVKLCVGNAALKLIRRIRKEA